MLRRAESLKGNQKQSLIVVQHPEILGHWPNFCTRLTVCIQEDMFSAELEKFQTSGHNMT